MPTMTEVEVTEGQTVTVGHTHAYRNLPTGQYVTVNGETFLRVGGDLYTTCGFCNFHRPGCKAEYAGVYDGVCFQCAGHGLRKKVGTVEAAAKVARRRQTDRARAERKRQEKEAAQVVARDEWVAANPELAARLAEVRQAEDVPGLVVEFAQRVTWQPLTEKQTAFAAELVDEYDEWVAAEAAKPPARYVGEPGSKDKVTVTGTVAVAMTVPGYAYGSSDKLVVIEGTGDDAGVTVKVVGSAAWLWEVERGDAVTVTGKVKRHTDYNGTPQTQLTYTKRIGE